ncbi:endonuclease [Loktanella sp. S4079]|nr:endonuclease [Loktanella sp. S4079]
MRFIRPLIKVSVGLGGVFVAAVLIQIYRNSGDTQVFPAAARDLRVATYNVHYIAARQATGPWSLTHWEQRKAPLNQAFQYLDADLVAFQEMETHSGREADQFNLTLDYLLENNPTYAAAAVGDPAEFPSTQPILYRRDRLALADQGWFFFSNTPDVIYSRTFNGSYPAFTSWAQFTDLQSGQVFRVVNIHTDFSSRSNRLQSVALVAERISPWIDAGETVLVMGDLNARLGDTALEIIADTGVTFAPVKGASFHFNRGLNLFGAIDHIGLSGQAVMAHDPIVVRRPFMGVWPTDHYPVLLDIQLTAEK